MSPSRTRTRPIPTATAGGDDCDNCRTIPNGPNLYAAGLSAVSQCDYDSDGYGNACDRDFPADGFVTVLDTPFYLAQLMGFFPGPSGWACAGVVTGACPPYP